LGLPQSLNRLGISGEMNNTQTQLSWIGTTSKNAESIKTINIEEKDWSEETKDLYGDTSNLTGLTLINGEGEIEIWLKTPNTVSKSISG